MEHPTGEAVRQAGDLTAVGIVVGTLVGWLPSIAALLTIVWTASNTIYIENRRGATLNWTPTFLSLGSGELAFG